MRRRGLLVVWGAALVAAAPLCAAGIVEPAAGSVLAAGSRVTARWDAAPADAHEMELLLSLDGGATYPLRLSAELDPAQRSFTWQVPALPAAAARVALRADVAGRETVVAESGVFEIASPPSGWGSREAVRRQAGELWPAGAAAAPGEEPALPRKLGGGDADGARPLAEGMVAEVRPGNGSSTVLRASLPSGGSGRRAARTSGRSLDPPLRTARVVPLRI